MRKNDVATINGPVSVFVNVGEVAVTFGPREGSPLPYKVNGVAYSGTIYMRKSAQNTWRVSQGFVQRVDDWAKQPTDAAWEVMITTAETLAEEFYTPENVKQAKRELLEYKIELAERKMAELEDELAELRSQLEHL